MREELGWSSTKYEDRAGDSWRGSRDPTHLAVASRIHADLIGACYSESIPTHARGHLLDLGCGKAPLFGMYRPFVDRVTCVDWPSSNHELQHVDCFANASSGLPFRNATFDCVILSDVLEHVREPDALWQELARVVRPGGKVLLNTPFLYRLHEVPHDYFRFTEFALRSMGEDAGFDVVELRPIGGAIDVLADLTAKLAAPGRVVGPMAAASITGFAKTMLRWRLATRLNERSAAVMPLAYFLVAVRRSAPPGDVDPGRGRSAQRTPIPAGVNR
jgi:SAM-dependent methyltransferase